MVELTLEESLYAFRKEVTASFRRNLHHDKAFARKYGGIRSSVGAYDALSVVEIKEILAHGDRSLLEETGLFASFHSGFRTIASYFGETVSSSYVRNNLSLLEATVVVKKDTFVSFDAPRSPLASPTSSRYSLSRPSLASLALGCAAALFSFYSKPAQPHTPFVLFTALSSPDEYEYSPRPLVLPSSQDVKSDTKPTEPKTAQLSRHQSYTVESASSSNTTTVQIAIRNWEEGLWDYSQRTKTYTLTEPSLPQTPLSAGIYTTSISERGLNRIVWLVVEPKDSRNVVKGTMSYYEPAPKLIN